MPEFQRKSQRFKHSGLQWNAPVDAIPDSQVCYGRNIRITQDSTITQRPGLTRFCNLGGTYVHSIARWNNFNTTLLNPTYAYIIGMDTSLYMDDTNGNLLTAAFNPVKLPPAGGTTTLSGNPLTMVDMAPVGTQLSWKYIGDANLNFSVGYYPGDVSAGMARALSMGMTPPVTPQTVPAVGAAGLLVGNYQWIYAFRNRFTGARSNPSAPTRVTLASPALTLASQAATLVIPTTPIDPQTAAADAHILVDIYRFGGTINDWRYVGTAESGTTHTDNVADASILTAATPPEVTDSITGVTRFNLFRPFVVQDNAVYSSINGTITVEATGKYILTANGADVFSVNWLPGQVISINNNAWTIYQVRSTTVIEIAEDPGANLITGTGYPWATLTGTLKAGTPLSHIWGPYGTGQGGAFIFGCGGTKADAGTLYWCNGNDPDSTDLANSLIVTSPSEPLRGGCVYDGTPFCWSTERMFRIYPSTVAGQFTVQEMPGGKGIWAEYSLTVQSNGISDQSVSWVGKDGIYDWSTSNGLQCITDRDLYPFFPHDNQVGQNLSTLFPFITEPNPVNAPDFSTGNMKYHRLCWFMGELFYDFPCIVSSANSYHTLVFDSKECKGWVSLDQYSNGVAAASAQPVSRGIEIAANNMKVGVGGVVLDYTGTDDNGVTVPCRLITKADDLGDNRGQKLYGDYWMDISPGGGALLSTAWTNNFTTQLLTETFLTASREQRTVNTGNTGLGILGRSFGLDATWVATDTPAILFQYSFSYVPKPEYTSLRATDSTDDGYPGAKFLQGLIIDCDTAAATRTVNVLVDGAVVATVSVTAAEQLDIPFGITPVIGSHFQIQPTDDGQWQLYQVRWVWEPSPELVTIYATQPTDHDLPGYHYLFDAYIAYIGSADAPSLLITTEYGTYTYTLPVSSGAYTRAYVLLHPQKAKWRSYKVTSIGGLRLFLKDCEVRAKNWTDKGQYPSSFQSMHPFGEQSRIIGARI